MNYFPFHLGDYAAHTGHLEPMEDLAYRRLLDVYYLREGPLPADVLATAKLVRMRSMAADVESVLNEFFVLTDAGWTHFRCEQEIERMQDKQTKARASAQASVNARKAKSLNERSTNADALFNERSTNAQENQTDVELPTPTPTPIEIPLLSEPVVPDCPHDDLIDIFGKRLPSLPQPRKSLWKTGKNAPAMKARWRWVMTARYESGKRKGERMATTPEEALAWFDRFFAYVAESDWLMGRTSDWSCDLGWLITAKNFEKVIEGSYDNKAKSA